MPANQRVYPLFPALEYKRFELRERGVETVSIARGSLASTTDRVVCPSM